MAVLTITASFSCTELETGEIYVLANTPNAETITVHVIRNGTLWESSLIGPGNEITFTDLPDGEYEVFAEGSVSGESNIEFGTLDCVVTPPGETPCTLAITDVVVTASTATATVTGATGITEYSLDEFETVQESNILIDIEPGNYILYARDKEHPRCIATYLFKIYESYGQRYDFGFNGAHDPDIRVFIDEKDYAGVSEELDKMGGSPVTIKMSDADILDPIRGTECTITVQAQSFGQFEGLYTADERKYRVRIQKGEAVIWLGYLLPNVFQYPHLPPPYDITLTATDGIGDLKQVDFKADNARFLPSFVSTYDVLKLCLYQLDLPLSVLCAVDVTGAGMVEGINTLKQAQASYLFAYDDDKIKNSYEVLQQLLTTFKLKINQNFGKWFVVPKVATSYSYQEFDQDGRLLTSGVYDPIVEIVSPTEGFPIYVNATQSINIAPGYKKQVIEFPYGEPVNMVPSGDFREEDQDEVHAPKGWEVTAQTNAAVFNDFDGYLTLTGTATESELQYAQSPPFAFKRLPDLEGKTPIKVSFAFTALRLASAKGESQDVEFVNLYFELKVGNYYAREDGYWQATQTRILYGSKKVNEKVEFEKLFRQPPVDGDLTIRFYAAESASFPGITITPSNISLPSPNNSGTVSFNYLISAESQQDRDRLKYIIPYYSLISGDWSLKPDNTWGPASQIPEIELYYKIDLSKERVNSQASYSLDVPASPFGDISIEFGQTVTAGFGANEIKLSNLKVQYGDFTVISTPKVSEELTGTNPANYKLVREPVALGLGDAPAGWYANGLYLDKLPIASWADSEGYTEQIQVHVLRAILDQTQNHKQVLSADILGNLHFNAVIWDDFNDQRKMPVTSVSWDLKRGIWSGEFVEIIGTAVNGEGIFDNTFDFSFE